MLYARRNCGKRFRLRYASSGYNLVMGSSTSERIVKTPEICGGRARVAGHPARVPDNVTLEEQPRATPDEVDVHLPSHTPAAGNTPLHCRFLDFLRVPTPP